MTPTRSARPSTACRNPSDSAEPIRAIFFDFDNVLVDSEPLHFECWAEVLGPQGIRLTWERYSAEMIGVSNQDMVRRLCKLAGKRYTRRFFTDTYAEKKALYERRAARCRVPRGLVFFFRRSRERYALAVVSSSGRSEVEPILQGQGILGCLAALVCQEDVERLKPFPDPYLRALELVNRNRRAAIRPAECLVVEDSGPGALAAERAGMKVLRVGGPPEVLWSLRRRLRQR